jgi:hypothetical protein
MFMKSATCLISVFGLVVTAFTTHAQTNRPSTSTSTPESDLVIVESEDTMVRASLGRKMAPLVANKQFEELDRMANDLSPYFPNKLHKLELVT